MKDNGTQNTLVGLLVMGNENCCTNPVQAVKPVSTPQPEPADMFADDKILKQQEEENKRIIRACEEEERRAKEKAKAAKKNSSNWFRDTFKNISNEIFSDDEMK